MFWYILYGINLKKEQKILEELIKLINFIQMEYKLLNDKWEKEMKRGEG